MALSRNRSPLESDIAKILTHLGEPETYQKVANNPELDQPLSRVWRGARGSEGEDLAPSLIVLVGLPGTGKSTFARRLAPRLGAAILESDALRRLLFASPIHADKESKRLFRAVQAVAHRLLQEGRSVIVDATNLREAHRRPYYDIAVKTGARLHAVHLTAPEDVILDRLADRRDVHDPNEASTAFEDVYALLQQREEAPRGEHLRVDTSDPVAIETALRTLEEAGRALTAAGPGGEP